MLNYLWAGMIVVALLFGVLTGRTAELSAAALSGGTRAVQLVLSIGGVMCLWSGVMKIAERSGLIELFAKLLRPVIRLLFGDVKKKSAAERYISMNMTANLFGLGNAATPMGLAAMRELSALSPEKGVASKSMIRFVVINTASLQLVPTTIAAMRLARGSSAPFDLLPAIWLTSACSLAIGLAVCFLCESASPARRR